MFHHLKCSAYIVFFVVLVNAERNYLIEFTQGNCYQNTSYIKALECSLRSEGKHQYLIDGRLELATPVEDFRIRTFIHFSRKNKQRITLYDLTLNGCELLDNIHRHRIISIFIASFKKYLNEIPKCPLKTNFNYTLSGFHFNVEDFPPFLPEAEFKATEHILYKNRIVGKIIFAGRVVYPKN